MPGASSIVWYHSWSAMSAGRPSRSAWGNIDAMLSDRGLYAIPPMIRRARNWSCAPISGSDTSTNDFSAISWRSSRSTSESGTKRCFYRTSEAYLYDLTAFAMSATKEPYLRALTAAVAPPGPDPRLRLRNRQRWLAPARGRLPRGVRRLRQPEHAVPALEAPPQGVGRDRARPRSRAGARRLRSCLCLRRDRARRPNPVAFLGELEARARLVLVNLLEPAADETTLHHPLPLPVLLDHAATHGLRRYGRYHARSHLVLYAPGTRSHWSRSAGGSPRDSRAAARRPQTTNPRITARRPFHGPPPAAGNSNRLPAWTRANPVANIIRWSVASLSTHH